jgi:cysteine desulfurase
VTAVYLDYNGSAPLDPRVAEAMADVLASAVGNASSAHSFGAAQRSRVDVAREQVAAAVGGGVGDVVFTAGATEANNLALTGLVNARSTSRRRVVISAVEHASVRQTAGWLADEGVAKVDVVPVTAGGYVDLDALDDLLADDVLVVSVMLANSETGVINDLGAVAELAHRHGALVHTDATQAVGRINTDMAALGADLLSLSGHKICGPGGVGALLASPSARRRMVPVIHGGGHERGLRSGSLNVSGIVGFGLAAELAGSEWEIDAARVSALRDELVSLITAGVGEVEQNGDVTRRLPNTANLLFRGADAEAVLVNLDPVAVSAGSACSSGAPEPSPVLVAMGLSRAEAAESLRFSLGRFTTRQEVMTAAARTIGAVQFVRSMNEDA